MATDDHRLAEKAATWEREPGPRDQLPETPPEPQRAADDLLIERPDLGVGCYTLVAAGDPIPAELAELPRTPRATREQRRRTGKG